MTVMRAVAGRCATYSFQIFVLTMPSVDFALYASVTWSASRIADSDESASTRFPHGEAAYRWASYVVRPRKS